MLTILEILKNQVTVFLYGILESIMLLSCFNTLIKIK